MFLPVSINTPSFFLFKTGCYLLLLFIFAFMYKKDILSLKTIIKRR